MLHAEALQFIFSVEPQQQFRIIFAIIQSFIAEQCKSIALRKSVKVANKQSATILYGAKSVERIGAFHFAQQLFVVRPANFIGGILRDRPANQLERNANVPDIPCFFDRSADITDFTNNEPDDFIWRAGSTNVITEPAEFVERQFKQSPDFDFAAAVLDNTDPSIRVEFWRGERIVQWIVQWIVQFRAVVE